MSVWERCPRVEGARLKAVRWSDADGRSISFAAPSATYHRKDVSRRFPVSDGVCREQTPVRHNLGHNF